MILSRASQRDLFNDFSYHSKLVYRNTFVHVTKFFESHFQSPFPSNFKPSKNTSCSDSVHVLPFFLSCLVQRDHWTPQQETVNCPRYNSSSHSLIFIDGYWIWSEILTPKRSKLWLLLLCPQWERFLIVSFIKIY